VTHLNIRDSTDGHAVAGFLDGRALDADGLDLQVLVVAQCFAGVTPLGRQRLVNDAIDSELTSGTVHSVQMRCWTPKQWEAKGMPDDLNAVPCSPTSSPVLKLPPSPKGVAAELGLCLPPAQAPDSPVHRPTTVAMACKGDVRMCDGECLKQGLKAW
jgi:acid stress-induced BolA-like protein IbaG/YrbA